MRRLFLGLTLASLVALGLLIHPAAPAAQGRTVLQQSDVSYLGYLDLPSLPYLSRGMAIRYVGGVRHFFRLDGTSEAGTVQELVDPGSLNTSMSLAYTYTSPFSSAQPNHTPGGMVRLGLYWDSVLGRICSSYDNAYDVAPQGGPDYTWSCASINDSTHTATMVGCWGVNRLSPQVASGLVDLPAWLSPSARVGVGFGGRHSASVGFLSHGPALFSIDPDTGTNDCPDTVSYTAYTPLLFFPLPSDVGPSGTPQPARNNITTYKDWIDFSQWNPQGAVGFYTPGTANDQGNLFTVVSTATKQGLLVVPTTGDGSLTTSVDGAASPTSTSARLTSITMPGGDVDVSNLLEIQYDASIGANCFGSHTVRVTGVSGRDITFTDLSPGQSVSSTPLAGGLVEAGIIYCHAVIYTTRMQLPWQVYDLIALGSSDATTGLLDPAHQWNPTYGAAFLFSSEVADCPFGVVFDPMDNRIFVGVNGNGAGGVGRVFVFQVNDSAPSILKGASKLTGASTVK